jgi:prepilin-type N-terminal cleavage/methylation domain-containing protein
VNLNQKGLTLVELLIAMVVSLIAMGLAYTTYSAQQRAYTNEQLVLDMQQNARSALAFMRREIRMAGYNPLGPSGTGVVDGFKTVRRDRLGFTLDSNGDGDDDDDNEGIVYRFKDVNDTNSDGIADAGNADLFRYHRQGSDDCSVVAFDIHAIAFAYAFDADGDGQLDVFPDAPDVVVWAVDLDGDGQLDTYLDTNKDGVIDANDNPAGAGLAAAVPMAQVRAVQVSVLARTRFAVRGHIENETYVVGLHRIAPNDGFKRSLVTGIAMVRNPGS